MSATSPLLFTLEVDKRRPSVCIEIDGHSVRADVVKGLETALSDFPGGATLYLRTMRSQRWLRLATRVSAGADLHPVVDRVVQAYRIHR